MLLGPWAAMRRADHLRRHRRRQPLLAPHPWRCAPLRGDKPTVVALATPTIQALDTAISGDFHMAKRTIDGRAHGPLLMNAAGRLHDRLQRVVPRCRVGPRRRHLQAPDPRGPRHSAIIVGLDAGVSLRNMQDFTRHAAPRPPAAMTAPDTPSTATPPTPSLTTSPAAPERSGQGGKTASTSAGRQ